MIPFRTCCCEDSSAKDRTTSCQERSVLILKTKGFTGFEFLEKLSKEKETTSPSPNCKSSLILVPSTQNNVSSGLFYKNKINFRKNIYCI